MNKKILSAVTVLSVASLLTACGNETKKDSTSKEVKSEKVETETSNDKVIKNLDKQFNTDGQKLVKVSESKETVDDTSDKPHSLVFVEVIDQDTRKSLIEIMDRVQSNEATDDDKTFVNSIRQIVSDEKKNLSGKNDVIEFIYQDESDNNMVIARSTKTKDIIQPEL